MRVLVLSYEYPPIGGGGGIICQDLSVRLAREGHEIEIVTAGTGKMDTQEKQERVRITRLGCARENERAASLGDMIAYVRAARKHLRQRLRTTRYDVCHCHFIVPTGLVARWLKREYDIPYVITAHGSDVPGHNPKYGIVHAVLKRTWRSICAQAICVVFPTSYLKNLACRAMGTKKMAACVIPNGIDAHYFSDRKRKGKAAMKEKKGKKSSPTVRGDRLLLYVGRLSKGKGVEDMIAHLPVHQTGWRLAIIGDGPRRDAVEACAKDSEWPIDIIGSIPRAEVIDWYRRAHTLVQPSRFENLSTVLLEAAASGCRLVAYDVGGNSEITREHLATTPQELTLQIAQAMRQSRGNDVKMSDFFWESVVKRYGEVYESA